MNIYSTEAFEPLRFFSCGNLFSKDGFIHQRRTLNCNVLIYVQEGKLYINRAGTEYAVSKGEYILLKGDEEHFGYKNIIINEMSPIIGTHVGPECLALFYIGKDKQK
mgnify:CR=1 FL=1